MIEAWPWLIEEAADADRHTRTAGPGGSLRSAVRVNWRAVWVAGTPPVCPWSGLLVPECKRPQGLVNEALGEPLCDCFEFPEWDDGT